MLTFEDIAFELENHHGIFSQLWSMGEPTFTDEIPTAAVSFDENGEYMNFFFNKGFWDSLSDIERKFVICHECLHVLLEHGIRSTDCPDKRLANIALDVVVNHTLLERFGFRRETMDISKDLVWKDTVYEKPDEIEDNREFEYYYGKLEEQGAKEGQDSIDDHSMLVPGSANGKDQNSPGGQKAQDKIDDFLDDQIGELSEEEQKELNDALGKENAPCQGRGTQAGGAKVIARAIKKCQKRCWEDIVQIWTGKETVIEEDWRTRSRRHTLLSEDFILPAEIEEDENTKVNLWFFQDTSGSCRHMADDFFSAALTFPEDKFDLTVHCFDTSVYPTDLKSRELKGFGGTSFSPIEAYIQANCGGVYPDAVFLFTDGDGDMVDPQYPDRWYWFLAGSKNTRCYPKTCQTFMFDEFIK